VEFEKLGEHEIPSNLKEAFVHLEVISGGLNEMLVPLTRARNTSNQVKEFAIENLGGGFDWLKEVIENSQFRGRVRYRENDPEPVDVRTVLGILTLFHPKWNELGKEPVIVRVGDLSNGLRSLRPSMMRTGWSLSVMYANNLRHWEAIQTRQEKAGRCGTILGQRWSFIA
jgi:hypothetical protein